MSPMVQTRVVLDSFLSSMSMYFLCKKCTIIVLYLQKTIRQELTHFAKTAQVK